MTVYPTSWRILVCRGSFRQSFWLALQGHDAVELYLENQGGEGEHCIASRDPVSRLIGDNGCDAVAHVHVGRCDPEAGYHVAGAALIEAVCLAVG